MSERLFDQGHTYRHDGAVTIIEKPGTKTIQFQTGDEDDSVSLLLVMKDRSLKDGYDVSSYRNARITVIVEMDDPPEPLQVPENPTI